MVSSCKHLINFMSHYVEYYGGCKVKLMRKHATSKIKLLCLEMRFWTYFRQETISSYCNSLALREFLCVFLFWIILIYFGWLTEKCLKDRMFNYNFCIWIGWKMIIKSWIDRRKCDLFFGHLLDTHDLLL